jgi:hypothetical protein
MMRLARLEGSEVWHLQAPYDPTRTTCGVRLRPRRTELVSREDEALAEVTCQTCRKLLASRPPKGA